MIYKSLSEFYQGIDEDIAIIIGRGVLSRNINNIIAACKLLLDSVGEVKLVAVGRYVAKVVAIANAVKQEYGETREDIKVSCATVSIMMNSKRKSIATGLILTLKRIK